MALGTEEKIKQTREGLERVQTFDTATLERRDDLGAAMNFAEAVQLADELISFFKQIPLTVLDHLSDNHLLTIFNQAQATYELFQEILDFAPNQADPTGVRETIIANMRNRRVGVFEQLWQFVAYSAAQATDFQALEERGRSAVKTIKDEATTISKDLEKMKIEAEQIMTDIRKTAEEQGVSQQAIYFKNTAKENQKDADSWLTKTYSFSGVLVAYTIASVFLHKIPFFRPESQFEAIQLVVSKALLFSVLSYLVYLAARQFQACRHNATVNHHRQTALTTFRALVDAAGTPQARDVVLAHASACIFAPQPTGYTRERGGPAQGSPPGLNILTDGLKQNLE